MRLRVVAEPIRVPSPDGVNAYFAPGKTRAYLNGVRIPLRLATAIYQHHKRSQ